MENVGNLSFKCWVFVFRMLGICPQNVGNLSLSNTTYSFIIQELKTPLKVDNTSNTEYNT